MHITDLSQFEKNFRYNNIDYDHDNLRITTQQTESEILVIETLLEGLKQNHVRQKKEINELETLY